MNKKIIYLTLFLLSLIALTGCRRRDSQYYTTELWEAVKKGDTAKVNSILSMKPELVNISNDFIHLAIWHCHEESRKDVVDILISMGADVNARDKGGGTPLHAAAGLGEKDIIEILLANGADIHARNEFGSTPLHNAALNGRHNGAIQLLLDNGADINAKSIDGETPIQSAWPLSHFEEESYDPNDECAIWSWETIQDEDYDDKIKTIKLFLDNGVDANTWYSFRERVVDKHADPNSTEIVLVYPLLQLATSHNQKELVEMLLAYGADVNSGGRKGFTALHFAALRGNVEIGKMLIEKGADVNMKTKDGVTPLYFAEREKNEKFSELLRKHKAR